MSSRGCFWFCSYLLLRGRIYIPSGDSIRILRQTYYFNQPTFLILVAALCLAIMLSLFPQSKTSPSPRSSTDGCSEPSDVECLTIQKPLRSRRKVDTVMTNIEVLVDEIVKKREAWGMSVGNKRRFPVRQASLPSLRWCGFSMLLL